MCLTRLVDQRPVLQVVVVGVVACIPQPRMEEVQTVWKMPLACQSELSPEARVTFRNLKFILFFRKYLANIYCNRQPTGMSSNNKISQRHGNTVLLCYHFVAP